MLLRSPSLFRRAALVAGAVVVSLAVVAPAASASTPDGLDGKKSINTLKDWTGNTVSPFGCPETTTYGQTITAPAKTTVVKKVTFSMNDGGATGSMVARGELYAWDGVKATGSAIAQSKPMTIDFADADWHSVTFTFKKGTIKPGSQYVVFASVDKDYEKCSAYSVTWASVDDTAYTGGTFVFQGNSGDESRWTTVAWGKAGIDAALKVALG